MGKNVFEALFNEYYSLVESAAKLDDLYESLGVLPEVPRATFYGSMWLDAYKAIAVEVGGRQDPYAFKVANDTVRRYLTDEYERVGKVLVNPSEARPRVPMQYDRAWHLQWTRYKKKAESDDE